VNLLNLIQADGGTLKRIGNTNGGEFAGPCPFCGGNDRFRLWPETGRYWCRSCEKSGDAIQYLRERRGLSYVEACHYLGKDPGPRENGPRPAPAPWAPKEAKAPFDLWQAKARTFLDGVVACLWSDKGAATMAWLHNEKGLQDATIRAAGLGYNQTDLYEPRGTWGLEPAINDKGQEKRQWIPKGLVIPLIIGGAVYRLRIRRDEPGDGARYIIVSGSSSAPMTLSPERGAAVIVESEIDAILLHQDAGDLVTCISMGTAQAKPDRITHETMKAAAIILISLDSDGAGAKAAWQFWPATYGEKARRWPSINGKDASDARLNGLDLRAWSVAGLFQNEANFERFCIQTVDGGLSDTEAIKAMDIKNGGE